MFYKESINNKKKTKKKRSIRINKEKNIHRKRHLFVVFSYVMTYTYKIHTHTLGKKTEVKANFEVSFLFKLNHSINCP